VTTSSPEAQAFYDQGLDYLHGYVWIEAARSFQQALRLDPKLAMAWVGLSRVYSGLDDPKAARVALEQAQALAAGAGARERRRIALRAKQLEAMDALGDAAKHADYKRAIDDALAVDFDQPELWLVRGNAEEPTAAGRGQRGNAASTAFYQMALRIAPEYGAAHHYLTHSYEVISRIPAALEHGEVYARVAPAIPHAHHMWGHDLRRVGRIDDAIAAFERTNELEQAYYAAEGIPAALDWHHVHNLDLLATAYQYKGQMRVAEKTMREAGALDAVTAYLEFNQKQLAGFLLGRQRWEEALAEARRLASGRFPATRTVGHAFAGHALLALGRAAEAGQALAGAERALAETPALQGGISPSRGFVEPYVETLRGEVLLRSGRAAEGRAKLVEIERRLRALPGPDAWIQALFRLEAIARTAREVGDWELAAHTAEQMMDHDPSYGGSHLARALVAAHEGKRAEAESALAAAEAAWREADPDLAELADIRARRTARR
jgi:tetratricopeptide (TPR) repeat protein